MLSLFLNPWTFLAGAALISAPIIIHLINRIRFRRIKWAAMEFLLKAQKRMRRRKILEQLLLLFLRCLLVFLAGILFARYLGGGCGGQPGQETRPTTHLVILDDTPSMADAWRREDGTPTDAYTEAKRLVYEKLMPAAGEATTAQTFQVVRLSEMDKPFPAKYEDGRVSATNIDAMESHLKPLQVATVRRSLKDGLTQAKVLLGYAPASDAKVIHVISDLRNVEWAEDGQAITDKLGELKELGVTVHLIDVANPARKPDRKSPQFTDNVAIIEVKPRNRVVALNQQTDIEVRIKNFGGIDLKDVRVEFLVNGVKGPVPTMVFNNLPANQEKVQSVSGTFTQTGTRERPLDRFSLITAYLASGEAGGLAIDNVRHTVVEVRPKLQVLVVEGRPDKRQRPEGDSFYMRKLFLENKDFSGFDWVPPLDKPALKPSDLDAYDLRPFSTIYLLNVPSLSAAAVANLERFVKEGGGVGVFLGPDVQPEEYNKLLHRKNDATGVIDGFFPVPLPVKYSVELTNEQKLARELTLVKRVVLRDPEKRSHPALHAIYTDDAGGILKKNQLEQSFMFANIDFYWPVSRTTWRDDNSVQELYCLPNDKSIAEFEERAGALVTAIKAKYGEAKFETARKHLDPLLRNISTAPATPGTPLSVLARYMDQLLCDQINDGDESEPILRDFWGQPELAEIKPLAMQLRDASKYGDPLYVVKQFGRGRVAVMTTDAGGTHSPGSKQWTDWPSGAGIPGWLVVVSEMQRYLAGGGGEGNLSVGDRFFAEFEAARYKPSALRHLLTVDPAKVIAGGAGNVEPKALGEQALDQPPSAIDAKPEDLKRPFQLSYSDAKVPGAYVFSLTRLKGDRDPPGTPAEQPDYAAVAFNVDAAREGDLRRANTDDLGQWTNKAPLHNTEDLSWIDDFKQKPTDMSSRRWLYLLILLVLLAEQAWAVRISYHTKPEDLDALAPSAAAAFAHTATPTPVSVAAADADAVANTR